MTAKKKTKTQPDRQDDRMDWHLMRYNPMVDDIETAYPELCMLPAWKKYEGDDLPMLRRYVLMMYSADSPMVRRYSNLDRRKLECLHLAGYHVSDPDDELIASLMDISLDRGTLDLIVAYLEHQDNYVFQMIVSTEEAFQEYQRMILLKVSTEGKDKEVLAATTIKTKLMEDCHRMAERLEGYYEKLYGPEVSKAIRQKGRTRPEDYAARI